MANANTTQFSDAIKTIYEKRLLMRALPRLVFGAGGKKASVSKAGSLEWRKYGSLSAVTSSLTEGTTPSEQAAPTLSKVTATPSWYGAWIMHSDQLDMQSFDPYISEMSAILGEQAGLSVDTLIRNELVTGLTADYSADQSAITDLDHPLHEISYKDIVRQIAELSQANARPLEGASFRLIISPFTWASLMQDEVFVNMFSDETDGGALRSGRVGKILNCNVYVTSNAYESADGGSGTTDVYSAIFLGEEAFGVAGMAGLEPKMVDNMGADEMNGMTGMPVNAAQVIIKPIGSSGTADPLDQRGTAGWKVTNDVQILNSAFGRNLYHTNVASDD